MVKNKKQKDLVLGYPYNVKTKIEIVDYNSRFKVTNDGNLELLGLTFSLLVLVLLSSNFILSSRSALALSTAPLAEYNPYYEPPVPCPSPRSGITLSARGYRWLFTILGFFGSRALGGQLLLPPSESMSRGYIIGCIMSWMIRFI